MRKQFFLTLPFFLLITVFSTAAEPLSLDCKTSIDLALKNNPDLIDAGISLGTSLRNAESSWNFFLPEIAVSFGVSGGADISAENIQGSSSFNPGLSLSYNFTPGLCESVAQLKLALERAEISYDSARLRLQDNVESEFYYLLTSRSNLEIQKKNIELAEHQFEQTELKFKNGLVPELEVLQARVNAANLQPAYSSLVTSYNNRLKEFLLVIGLNPSEGVELSGSLDIETQSFNVSKLINNYIVNRSDIKTQIKQIELLESSYRKAVKHGTMPSLNLSASVNESVSDPFAASGWENYSPGINASVTVSASLGLDDYIPGSSTRTGIKEIEDSVRSAKLKLDTITQNAKLEVMNIVDSLETNRENLELSLLNLELSELSFSMTQKSFENGKSDRITLEDAQQNLLTAEQNLLESKYEYLNGLITLRSALGLESLTGLIQE